MTDKLQVADVPEEKAAATSITPSVLLKRVIAQIRRDSVEGSKEYLDETTVPHGGE
jgi:hypothetical protein